MTNIIELQTILNQIPAPLLIRVSRYHINNVIISISFNINESITFFSNKPHFLIPEKIYPTLIQFDIKVENFKKILIQIQSQLNKCSKDEFKILHQYILAKDSNHFYYQIQQEANNIGQTNPFAKISPLFFSGQAVTWLPLNITSESQT